MFILLIIFETSIKPVYIWRISLKTVFLNLLFLTKSETGTRPQRKYINVNEKTYHDRPYSCEYI